MNASLPNLPAPKARQGHVASGLLPVRERPIARILATTSHLWSLAACRSDADGKARSVACKARNVKEN